MEEPPTYSTRTVTLQNVSTYDFFIYLHDFVASDSNDGRVCTDTGVVIDFAHSGEPFFQSGTGVTFSLSKRSFSSSPTRNRNRMIHQLLPKKTMVATPSNVYSPAVNVSGQINPDE